MKSLIDNNPEPLYCYNQYILKRFFEYAFTSHLYVQKLKTEYTGLHTQTLYCPKHERVIMTACITALSNMSHTNIYKKYYINYLDFKSKFMLWRGRIEWFDFHSTLYSHFIWKAQMEDFYWTWQKMCLQLKNFKKRYPRVSDWRRKWYATEMSKLRLYLVRCCLVSNKLQCIPDMINNNIITPNKNMKKLCLSFGYDCNFRGKIIRAPFCASKEWKWIQRIGEHELDHKCIDIFNCVEVCMNSYSDKSRLFDLFNIKPIAEIWSFFLRITNEQLTYITCKKLCAFLAHPYSGKPQRIVDKMFELHTTTTKTLQRVVSDSINQYKMKAEDGVEHLIHIFKTCKYDDYNYLQFSCDVFVQDKGTLDNQKYALNVHELYWLYKLLSPKLHSKLRKAVFQTNVKNCDDNICPICLCELEHNGFHKNYTLPCGHGFHENCVVQDIHQRLKKPICTYNCPLCRTNIHVGSLHFLQNY